MILPENFDGLDAELVHEIKIFQQANELNAQLKWWEIFVVFAVKKVFGETEKKVKKLVFNLSRGGKYKQSVHFENPVSFVDAVLAADKQLDQPLTKEVWDKVRDDQGLVESFENITQKGGHLLLLCWLRLSCLGTF